ncbi:autophagy protein 17 [Aureococcus anophagefferens]|uniref:Autophagy protein 17 n=1 Tax=Aureococcus anophagefferens TaxID=44056 RepID=A0ABR1FL36_AURAN
MDPEEAEACAVVHVGCAHSGEVIPVEVWGAVGSARSSLRRLVADACGCSEASQIVLCGPPWRPLDAESAAGVLARAPPRGSAGARASELRVFAYDRAAIKAGGDGPQRHGGADAADGRVALEALVVPRTLPEARRLGLLDDDGEMRESDAMAGSPTDTLSVAGSPGEGGPLQRALGDFASQFKLRLAQGRAYARAATNRAAACRGLADRAAVRSAAVAAALLNLGDHGGALSSAHGALAAKARRHGDVQRDALERFEDDLDALGRRALHPALARAVFDGDARAHTLAECVPAERVRKWAEHCARTLAAVEADGARVGGLVADVAGRVDALVAPETTRSMRDRVDGLEAAAAAVAALAEDQRRAVDDLDGDERDASRLAAGARSGVLEDSGSGEEPTSCMSTSATSPKNTPPNADLGGFFPAHRGGLLDDSDAAGSESGTFGRGSTGALDACRELQTRWESRDRSLPAIKATEKAVRDGAKGCALEAEALADGALRRVRDVADAQSRIHGARSRHLAAFGDALRDKAAHFAQLDAVRRLPRAHAALCLEVARRRAYGVAAVAAVRGAADAVAALRDAEHERRLRFARSHGQRLPRALLKAVPALLEAPATFSPTFDPETSAEPLPDVALSDLAPDGTPLSSADPADQVQEKRPRAWSCESAVGNAGAATTPGSTPPKRDPDVRMAEATATYGEDEARRAGGSVIYGDRDRDECSDDPDDCEAENRALRARCAKLEVELAALRAEALEKPRGGKPAESDSDDFDERDDDVPETLGRRGRALSEDSAEVKRDLAAAARGIGDLEAALGLEYARAAPPVRSGASIAAIREAHQRYPDFILGRVTRAEPRDVTNDPDSNPYRLPLGTVFHVLAVESL